MIEGATNFLAFVIALKTEGRRHMRHWIREPSLSIHMKVIDEYCLLGESCWMAHIGALMNRIPLSRLTTIV